MRLSLGLADCSSEERCCDTNPHKHILYLPPSDMRAQIFIFLDSFKEYKRKITPLSFSLSSAHGEIINALPSGLGCADVQERIRAALRSSTKR